jgi:hypothetical protein
MTSPNLFCLACINPDQRYFLPWDEPDYSPKPKFQPARSEHQIHTICAPLRLSEDLLFLLRQTGWQGFRLLLFEPQTTRRDALKVRIRSPSLVGRGLLEQLLRDELANHCRHVDGV